MRSADIEKKPHAVKVPIRAYGREQGTQVLRGIPLAKLASGKWRVKIDSADPTGGAGPTEDVSPAAILQPWDAYVIEQAHEEALREDREREQTARYEARAAEVQADVEGWVHLFEGLPESSGTYPDQAEMIHDYFVRTGSMTLTMRREDMRAIAKRISDLQQAVLAAGGGWTISDEPIIDGAREVVTLAPAASSTLAALEAAVAASEDEGE